MLTVKHDTYLFTSPQKLHKPEVNGETFFKYYKKKKNKKLSTQSSIPPENLYQKGKRKKDISKLFQTLTIRNVKGTSSDRKNMKLTLDSNLDLCKEMQSSGNG